MRTRIDDLNPPPPPGDLDLTPKRAAVLDLFTRYEILPANYINVAADVGWKPICDLKKYHYIGVPDMEGARPLDARNRVRALALLPRGESLLGRKGYHSADNSFKHKLLISLAKFSFDRATAEIPGLRKLELADILSHPQCPPETAAEEHPNNIPIGGYVIKPDAELFGYELNGRYIFIHGFEADRGTERGTPNSEFKKKSIESMVRNYGTYIRESIYYHRYGFVNVLCPFICDTPQALARIMHIVHRDIEPELWENFPGMVLSTDPRNYPPPTAHLVTNDWQLADGSPFNILGVLDANRPQDTGSTERAA